MKKEKTNLQSNNSQDTKEESDFFATGQFLCMTDAEKLDLPPFERMEAGITSNGFMELTVALPERLFNQIVKESKKQNIKTEVLIRIVIERIFSRKNNLKLI